jgi:hypothetical protein
LAPISCSETFKWPLVRGWSKARGRHDPRRLRFRRFEEMVSSFIGY